MKPKLSSSVSVVKIDENIVEFFKSNTREQVRLKGNSELILKIVDQFDGTKTLEVISNKLSLDMGSLRKLVTFLKNKGIMDLMIPTNDFSDYKSFRRTYNFLNDFATSHDELVEMVKNISNSTVMIIGVGAVGSWVAANLVQSGVRRLILMDPDKVDQSNLHRQFGYFDGDEGNYKVDVLEQRLLEYSNKIDIIKDKNFLGEDSLKSYIDKAIDLVINCADQPNVDTTSKWVGKFCMENQIPHIVGGGYNLHLSLIGQTIIPGNSACVKCFEKTLLEKNNIDDQNIKKLVVKNRKIGSIGPMCATIASLIGMEAIKVLSKKIRPANLNRRGEFDVYTMGIKFTEFERRNDCEWCGKHGKYST